MVNMEKIKGAKIFDGLNKDELQDLAKICHEKRFWKDDIVIKQGEVDESMNILIEGELRTEVEIPGFKESISVHNLQPNDVFGELAFIARIPRSATVRCISTATVLSLERTKFDKLYQKSPNIERIVMKNLAILLAERLKDTTIQMRDHLSKLPSKIITRKVKSFISELAYWTSKASL